MILLPHFSPLLLMSSFSVTLFAHIHNPIGHLQNTLSERVEEIKHIYIYK